MSLSWTRQIAKALAGGRQTPALELHLDALLVWLSNPDNPRAAELERAIVRQRLGRAEAGANAYRLLDQLLFAGDAAPTALGFAPGTQATSAKQRYRRLMQVYHPDRHPDRTAWATRRTEQINRAFAAFQNGERGAAHTASQKQPTRRETADAMTRRLPPAWLPSALRDLIAPAWVWTHARCVALTPLQQRLLNTAAGVLVLVLAITFWPQEPPKPVPKIIHHPLGSAPEPARAPEPEPEPPQEKPRSVVATAPAVQPSPAALETAPPSAAPPQMALAETPVEAAPAADAVRTEPAVATPSVTVEPPMPGPADQSPVQPVTAPVQQQSAATDLAPRSLVTPQTVIPSAVTPAPPKPPTPPETPPALSAAPTVSSLPLVGASPDARCRAAPEILHRFQSAYQNGALDPFMALYSPLAKENDLATWFAIRQAYAAWFRATSARRIGFEQIQVQPIADSRRCALMAVFQVSYLDRQARLVTQSGVIELLLEHRDADWLILRSRY